jgi:hypothetical protein
MALSQREITERFDEHHKRINKVEVDVYFGDGKENPPIVVRLDRVEKATASIDKLFWAVVIGIIAAIGDIVSHHF